MAIDEALLEGVLLPTLRFYSWEQSALSFGYFGRYAEVANEERALVRRWTGGGIVWHGDDLTYSVILPRGETKPQSRPVYASIHEAIRRALAPIMNAQLAHSNANAVSASCFANPVASDVLVNGKKIAGAAHRRTRAGLLHQGSIQGETLPADFRERFAAELCPNFKNHDLRSEVLARAEILAREKYGTDTWLRQR